MGTLYSLDIETTGLDLTRSSLLGIAITNSDNPEDCLYYTDAKNIEELVQWLHDSQTPLIAWNAFFDFSRLKYWFPWANFNIVGDAAVLAMMLDNSDLTVGVSLKNCVAKYLNSESYATDIINWLNDNRLQIKVTDKIDEGNFREYLVHCPKHLVRAYCKEDAARTLQLWYWFIPRVKCDVNVWMQLFVAELNDQIEAFVAGIPIDLEGLKGAEHEYTKIIREVNEEFYECDANKTHLKYVAIDKQQDEYMVRLYKSKSGSVKPKPIEHFHKKELFKTTSQKDLAYLFKSQNVFFNWDESKWEFPEVTPKGQPSFSKNWIEYYGEGGEILHKLGTSRSMQVRVGQILSEVGTDDVWRCNINLMGAKTGRISSNGSNILAMPVEEKPITSNIIAPEGMLISTVDFVSLEPSIQAHLSNDKQLRYAVYDGEGKKPFWDNGKLWIDDIYLTVAASDPKFAKQLDIDPDLWLSNKEAVTDKNKVIRKAFKAGYLMITYGASVNLFRAKLSQSLKQTVPILEAAKIYNGIWKSFPGLYLLRKELRDDIKEKGYCITEFGYPLTFRAHGTMTNIEQMKHKQLNRLVQSSAAGVMKLFILNFVAVRPEWMRPLIPNWHDARFDLIPEGREVEAEAAYELALKNMNEALGWEFPLRLSFKTGKSLYALKE